MDWFRRRIRRSPQAALIVGKVVFLAGAILVLAAVFARVALMGANADRAQAGQAGFAALADAFPQHPTWLVPEGPVGFTVAALLVLGGMALTLVALDEVNRIKHRAPTR
ncbi:MAG: hypothetical protein EOO24_19545 [Comamonadaceae bacterium]|nr:MAG: hypothetical protein EOO24_19545 [Comamonadaceae bacterium]